MTTLDTRSTRSAGLVAQWSSALRVGPTAAVVGALAMVITWLGSWNPSYWGDEAATVVSANRPIGTLLAELGHIDAVHGLYYLGMHFWIGLFGPSELSTRAPSAIAVGLLVAGTVVLGARLAGLRYGILAGVVCAILPRTTFLATEARSYAIGTAIAVWVTVYFVGLLRRRETRLWPWLVLGVLVALAGYLFLYLVLLTAIFGVVILTSTSNRRHLGRWMRSLVATGVLAAPIVVLAYLERGQVAFLAIRGYATPGNVIVSQWFGDAKVGGNALVPILGWSLILLAASTVIVRAVRRSPTAVLENRTSDRDTVRLGLAWLLLPTSALLLGNEVSPMYNVRYLSFSTPAVALLIAVGLVAAGRVAARAAVRVRVPRASEPTSGDLRTGDRGATRRRATMAVAAILLLALGGASLPGFLAQRGPYAKNGGSDWRQVADYIQANASPGDAVVFDPTTKPSKRPELAYRMYPQQFAAVDAVAVETPYYERAALWDVVAPLAEVRSDLARSTTVWALELPVGAEVPEDIVDLTSHGYRVVRSHLVHHTVIYQLQKENA